MKKVEATKLSIREILSKLDFLYDVQYDLNTEYAEDHDERCKDDYCRCSTISPEVSSFAYKDIAAKIIRQFDIKNEKIIYCVDRICSTIRIDDFYCLKSGGYYGEELDSITIDNYEILDKLEESIDIKLSRKRKLDKLKNESELDDKIRDVLTMEYGYLLDYIKASSFSIIEIDTKDIIFPQTEYLKTLSSAKVGVYKNHSGICGIVRLSGNKYKVIDGYHRISSNLHKSKIKVILSQ